MIINKKKVLFRSLEFRSPHSFVRAENISYKGRVGKVAPNRVHRYFNTSIPHPFNRETISYGISTNPSASNIMNALNETIEITADCKYRRTFNSDQGWAYQMKVYTHTLISNRIYQSMSRKGNCYDNSVKDNFFGIIKQEMYYGVIYNSYGDLKIAIEK